MLRILADDHDTTMSLDDLALFADLLNGWFYFHCVHHAFLTVMCLMLTICLSLFSSPGNSTLGEVVYGNFNRNLITGKNSDIIHTKLTRNVGSNDMPVGKLNLEYGVRQCLDYRTLEFYNVVLRQNNPSLMGFKSLINLCQNYHAVIGYRHSVLIVSRERAVSGYDSPFVAFLDNVGRADIYHRFDRYSHTGAKSDAASFSAEVRHVGRLVKLGADTVADVAFHD